MPDFRASVRPHHVLVCLSTFMRAVVHAYIWPSQSDRSVGVRTCTHVDECMCMCETGARTHRHPSGAAAAITMLLVHFRVEWHHDQHLQC